MDKQLLNQFKEHIVPDKKFWNKDKNDYVKIMAVVDNYVMARRKGCAPFCKSKTAFIYFLKKLNFRVK